MISEGAIKQLVEDLRTRRKAREAFFEAAKNWRAYMLAIPSAKSLRERELLEALEAFEEIEAKF